MSNSLPTLEMKIKMVPIDTIRPYWRNPRINEETVEELDFSINRYGFKMPLLIDRDNVIVVGHARYKALRAIGHAKVPCVVSDLDDQKNKEYRILDNKIGEKSIWDEKELNLELQELHELDQLTDILGDVEGDLSDLAGDGIPDVDDNDMEKADTKIGQLGQGAKPTYECVCPKCGAEFSIGLDSIK